MTPSCFVCGCAMRPIYGSYAWKCHHCDVTEEHEPWVNRIETTPEAVSEAFGETVFVDHSAEYLPSPGLYLLVSKAVAGCQEKVLPDV